MARIKLKNRKTEPGLRVAKVLFLGRAKRPSNFNLCVSGKLKGQKHIKAPKGLGGLRNLSWQRNFISTVEGCGARVTDETKAKWEKKMKTFTA